MKNDQKISKYKSTYDFNIGIIIFAIVIVYLLFNVFSYFTKSNIAVYQVSTGKISSNYTYQGVAIREESIVYAPTNGYVNYHAKSQSKVSVRDYVYSIDKTGTISNQLSASLQEELLLNGENISSVSQQLDSFMNKYNSNSFGKSYDFLQNLNADIIHSVNLGLLDELNDEILYAEANGTFSRYTPSNSGVVLYSVDGYEEYTLEDYLSNGIYPKDYHKEILSSNRKINTNDPVYKMISNEKWNILIPIESTTVVKLAEKNSIKIRFCKDDFICNANISLIHEGDQFYLNLSLTSGMIRYADERYLDVELMIEDISGLKIPKSAITTKNFFTVPKEYFFIGGDSKKNGLLVKQVVNGEESVATFIIPTIYYETDEYYYIDSEELSYGDIVYKENSKEQYVIGTDIGELIGVYNINKGYAVFKQINILYENNEYAIVETKTSYGISAYDHIALDASTVTEHQIISK